MNHHHHILIIGYVWPEPDSSAAGKRMMQLISVFQAQGWEVTFASAAKQTKNMINLGQLGINTADIEVNDSGFDEFVGDLHPDMVLFDRFITEEQFGWRVAGACPEAMRILDTEDLHSLRKARKKALDQARKFQPRDLLAEQIAKREVASIYRSDLSLIISEAEMHFLRKVWRVDESLIYYLPFLLPRIDEKTQTQWPDFEQRKDFITVGNFRHGPNLDAIKYLKKEIWPVIRKKLPKAVFHAYGAYPSQQAFQFHDPEEHFVVKGRVADAGQAMRQARVCLAPLRFGAGLKGKLIQAMQCGTPSVTTDIGAEGLAGACFWSGAIANDAADFANAAVSFYTDQERGNHARERGMNIINKRFQKEMFVASFLERICEIQENLEEHRQQNFTGAMLRHHTLESTKYMSRWIEAKNR